MHLFLDAHERAPKEIVLDLDATDDPLHGRQELPLLPAAPHFFAAAISWRRS